MMYALPPGRQIVPVEVNMTAKVGRQIENKPDKIHLKRKIT